MATKLTLKLVVDKSSNKVLFAEASKDAVDFLFGLLTLPLGSVVKLLYDANLGMVGSLTNLFEGLNDLPENHFISDRTKSVLLSATRPYFALPSGALLPAAASPAEKKLFKCSNSACNLTAKFFAHLCSPACPLCSAGMRLVKDRAGEAVCTLAMVEDMIPAGFVRSDATYSLTDDLSVSPMSIGQIALLTECKGRDCVTLDVRTVVLGQEEALELLSASLQSNSVLTDVFLAEKKSPK